MGHIRHNAMIVTGYADGDLLKAAHSKALELGLVCSPIIAGGSNITASFAVLPHGSKTGWDRQVAQEEAREAFKDFLAGRSFTGLDWCEAYFGGDDDTAHVVCHSGMR